MLNDQIENIDDLIGKVLSAEANGSERQNLDDWIVADPANKAYFDQMQTLFEASAERLYDEEFDSEAAWNKVSDRINPTGVVIKMNPAGRRRFSWAAAASVAIILGTGILFYILRGRTEEFSFASGESVTEQHLADGSHVMLNKNSNLQFEINKRAGQRMAHLNGEAFFEVVHDEKQEFIIESGGVFIKDIGTAFNVKALNGSDTVEVFVKEGEVAFYTNDNHGVNLKEGESALYIRSAKRFEKNQTPEDLNPGAYFDKVFRFRNAPLSRVIKSLNQVYGNSFGLADEAISNCKITVSFEDESPEIIAQIIAETLGLECTNYDGRITFSGQYCQ